MENNKTKIGIEQIQNIKMTTEEKENMLGQVMSFSASDIKPLKSPYSFFSIFPKNQFVYIGVIVLLLVVLGGGNMLLNYSKNSSNQVARINNGGINTFPTNTNNFNNTIPTINGNKNTTTSPTLPSSPLTQNTNNGNISTVPPVGTAAPTMMAPTIGNNNVKASLGSEFTLAQNEIAIIDNTDLQINISEFSYSPCTGTCVWSGVGINFEYSFNGKKESGMNLMQAFGYQVKILSTDYKTYARMIVTKI